MYIAHNVSETVVCEVSPYHSEYGKKYPIFAFYNDGTISIQTRNIYERSTNMRTKKPRGEFTLLEYQELIDGSLPLLHFIS